MIPEHFLAVLGPMSDILTVPLTDPVVEHSIGLVAVDRDPISPLVLAAFECAPQLELPWRQPLAEHRSIDLRNRSIDTTDWTAGPVQAILGNTDILNGYV